MCSLHSWAGFLQDSKNSCNCPRPSTGFNSVTLKVTSTWDLWMWFGNRVFLYNVSKFGQGHNELEWVLIQWLVPYKKTEIWTESHTGKSCDADGRYLTNAAPSQGTPRIATNHLKLGRWNEGSFLKAFWGSITLPVPCFWTLGSQHCKRICFCWLKPQFMVIGYSWPRKLTQASYSPAVPERRELCAWFSNGKKKSLVFSSFSNFPVTSVTRLNQPEHPGNRPTWSSKNDSPLKPHVRMVGKGSRQKIQATAVVGRKGNRC